MKFPSDYSARKILLSQLRPQAGQQQSNIKHVYSVLHSPHKLISISDFRQKYEYLTAGTKAEEYQTVVGRIISIRESSSALLFIDIIRQHGEQLQAVLSQRSFASPTDFADLKNSLATGDIVQISGTPGRTKSGELSVFVETGSILSPCLHPLPSLRKGMHDLETKIRQRHLDLLVNEDTFKTFFLRSKIISYLREFLNERGFLEVETPVLSSMIGGANARPFTTTLHSLALPLSMRISPELYLKRCVIGGMERVYEIGKQFRNEGMDTTHNPEFTTCEFYKAYSNCQDVKEMTKEFMCGLLDRINEGRRKILMADGCEIDFDKWQEIDIINAIEQQAKIKLPPADSPEFMEKIKDIVKEHQIHVSKNIPSQYLAKTIEHFVEPLCGTRPTFLLGHPTIVSPLAQEFPHRSGITDRFEAFAGGYELINAYSELTNPFEQRRRFAAQESNRAAGDDEAQVLDEDFCSALETGLPPTAGWGLGIDRLVMLLTKATSIRQVILFPCIKPKSNDCQ